MVIEDVLQFGEEWWKRYLPKEFEHFEALKQELPQLASQRLSAQSVEYALGCILLPVSCVGTCWYVVNRCKNSFPKLLTVLKDVSRINATCSRLHLAHVDKHK